MPAKLASLHELGFGERLGYGAVPALLVIDFSKGFTDPAAALGAEMAPEIEATNRLIAAARQAGAAIVFTVIAYRDPAREAGIWRQKIRGLDCLLLGSEAAALDPRLDREAQDQLLVKPFASAFFGTDLAQRLQSLGVDSLIVAGCTTSGCVRASVVDACQLGLRCTVALEATADRLAEAHRQSLIDMDLKYADVRPVAEILSHLAHLRPAHAAGKA